MAKQNFFTNCSPFLTSPRSNKVENWTLILLKDAWGKILKAVCVSKHEPWCPCPPLMYLKDTDFFFYEKGHMAVWVFPVWCWFWAARVKRSLLYAERIRNKLTVIQYYCRCSNLSALSYRRPSITPYCPELLDMSMPLKLASRHQQLSIFLLLIRNLLIFSGAIIV